jgi:hypothetical protein
VEVEGQLVAAQAAVVEAQAQTILISKPLQVVAVV